ncbi:MAG: heparan-alpha-glucosaminide N-acetyltransferase [Candidatus Nanoarchaeia archaeon]|nr:heparan-alpha-glucosaminide N-acetyltransferase [Candidatus Nanoarchaeia archaeon]
MARFWEIDFFRGIAVIMMIIFHSLFYINYFDFAKLELYSGFIGRFQMIIPLIFLTVSGISSKLQARFVNKKAVFLRGLKVLGLGLIITLITWLIFPKDFVFFGILHCIGTCILLSYFIKNEKIALILGLIVLFISSSVNSYNTNYKYVSIVGLRYAQLNTFDYYPLIPWLGVFLIGYYLGSKFIINKKSKINNNKLINAVCFFGKNSLKIYFIHIIFLFSFFWILKNILI